MIGADHPVLGIHGGTLDNGQQIPLYSLPRHIGSPGTLPRSYFVNFIQEDNARMFHPFDGQLDYLVHIDQPLRFLLGKDFQRFREFDFAPFGAARHHVAQHLPEVDVHLFQPGTAENLDHGVIAITDLQIHIALVKPPFSQQPAEFFTRSGTIRCLGPFELSGGFRAGFCRVLLTSFGGQQNIQGLLLSDFTGPHHYLLLFFPPDHVYCQLAEITNHRFHITSYIPHLRKLRGLKLQKR